MPYSTSTVRDGWMNCFRKAPELFSLRTIALGFRLSLIALLIEEKIWNRLQKDVSAFLWTLEPGDKERQFKLKSHATSVGSSSVSVSETNRNLDSAVYSGCKDIGKIRVKMLLSMKKTSYSWWFDSHSSQRRSPWLQSTISELDEKILAMLKLIEEDADSFAESAEMYCKKRPELVNMVEGLYRAHRSLAEQFDKLKLESGIRQITPPGCPFNGRYQTCKLRRDGEISYDSYSDAFDFEDSGESEVDDPEQEEKTQAQDDREMREEEVSSRAGDSVSEIMKLREELERLKEENRIQTDQLMEKDEEKREVIRQLSLSVEVMKKESTDLRKTVAKAKGSSKGSLFELGRLKAAFSMKLF
uniref:NAB domain-containing protein n=1 Tax=Nelumbo nucifera TaxID=4432 RepID=A0A822YQ35_NELNU|nr:TPA_asm: hypothetical protein HUJ06_012310 [Nelumbo nucifera]